MQNAVDIMVMVQKANMPKQKFDVPSKTFGNDKASFKKELFEARKEMHDNRYDKKPADSTVQRTTENKAEKLAKVMSNSNTKAELKESRPVDAMEQSEAAKTETVESKVESLEGVEKPEESLASEETKEPVMEMLQQLMQMLETLKQKGNAAPDMEALKTELQGAIEKLELVLTMPVSIPTEELNNQLKDLKIELGEFMKQLETASEKNTDTKQVEQLLKDFTEKVNKVEKQLYQVIQQKADSGTEVQLKTGANVETTKAEDVKTSTESEIAVPGDKMKIAAGSNEKASDNSNKSEKENHDEASHKVESKVDTKQTANIEKPETNDLKNVAVPQNQKLDVQLNIKQVASNLGKNNMVKINSTDIINQVIKKADIIVQSGHQEMIMKLEPESLGKLNLKLVVENGLVTAKFVAESQQVKEVLESSFNQLKDALQEKGIAVQGFSVSVGQQGAEFNSSQSFDQWKKSIKLSKTATNYMELDEETALNVNPYSYHEGKVDYRA